MKKYSLDLLVLLLCLLDCKLVNVEPNEIFKGVLQRLSTYDMLVHFYKLQNVNLSLINYSRLFYLEQSHTGLTGPIACACKSI